MTPRANGFVPLRAAEAGAAVKAKPDLMAARVSRAVPDLVDGVRLRRWRGSCSAGAVGVPQTFAVRAELAGARIVDHAVDHAVGGIAGGHRRGRGLVSFAEEIGRADQILHHDLAPHLRRLEPRPVHRRGIGEDAVELRTELLRQHIALPPARRAAVPIVVDGLRSVIGPLATRLGEEDLLLHPVADEVVDELQVIGSVGVHAGLAVAAGCGRYRCLSPHSPRSPAR